MAIEIQSKNWLRVSCKVHQFWKLEYSRMKSILRDGVDKHFLLFYRNHVKQLWTHLEYIHKCLVKAWHSIGEAPYCFPRSSTKFQGHAGKKMPILTQIERFQTAAPVWNHRWVWNDAQSLTWYRRDALLFFEVIHHISRSHGLNPI